MVREHVIHGGRPDDGGQRRVLVVIRFFGEGHYRSVARSLMDPMLSMIVIVNRIDMAVADDKDPVEGFDFAALVSIAHMLIDELLGEIVHKDASIVMLKYEIHVLDAQPKAPNALHGVEREIFQHPMVIE